jgi:hypothetical protein
MEERLKGRLRLIKCLRKKSLTTDLTDGAKILDCVLEFSRITFNDLLYGDRVLLVQDGAPSASRPVEVIFHIVYHHLFGI